jgi:hypothetical protein
MKELIILIVVLIAYIIAEPIRNIHVIKDNSRQWHSWQFVTNLLFFIPFFFLMDWRIVVISGLMFWQIRDSVIGYSLTKNIFYLGSKGMDGWINKVFQSGKTFAIIRIAFILV